LSGNRKLAERLAMAWKMLDADANSTPGGAGRFDETAEMPVDATALADLLFGDITLGDPPLTESESAPGRPLPRIVDLWLSRDGEALLAAVKLLGLEPRLVPDLVPLLVVRGGPGEVYRATLPPAAWPDFGTPVYESLDVVLEDARVAARNGDNPVVIASTSCSGIPPDSMIVVWPLLAGLGPEALPAEQLRQRGVRRTVWFEPTGGRVAATDLQATLSHGMPGDAVRICVLGASMAGRRALKTDRTSPVKALGLQLQRLQDVVPAPWLVIAP
jgi:hypothetical protein